MLALQSYIGVTWVQLCRDASMPLQLAGRFQGWFKGGTRSCSALEQSRGLQSPPQPPVFICTISCVLLAPTVWAQWWCEDAGWAKQRMLQSPTCLLAAAPNMVGASQPMEKYWDKDYVLQRPFDWKWLSPASWTGPQDKFGFHLLSSGGAEWHCRWLL